MDATTCRCKDATLKGMPVTARAYVLLVCAAGAASALGAVMLQVPRSAYHTWDLPVFVLLAAIAGGKKIELVRPRGSHDGASMSLGYAVTVAAMLRFGPAAGLLVGSITALSSCVYPKPYPAHQLVFNVALTAVESWLAGLAYLQLNGWSLALRPYESAGPIVASCLVSYLVNTGGVSIVIALCSGERIGTLWRTTFLWTAPSYFAGASISALGLFLFGERTGVILLFGAPVAFLTYYSYAVYTARAEEHRKHIEELQVSQAQLADLYLATIKSLALAIDAKDKYTHQHIVRVQRYAVAVAVHLGLSESDIEGVKTGALLHDIGKLGVAEYVLLKPGRLAEDEFKHIQRHPEIGAAILDPVSFPWPVVPAVKHHHEKWDGTGYPDGLRGEQIPLPARILAVADVYDALTSTRSYRTAWPHEKAVDVIRDGSGKHFDPTVAAAFLAVIGGVISQMAEEGIGPLAPHHVEPNLGTMKADLAARDIQRAAADLWALYEVAQTLSSSLALAETVDILSRKLEAMFPGSACAFLLMDKTRRQLDVRAASGVNREFLTGAHTLGPTSRSMRAAVERETYNGGFDQDDLLLTSVPTTEWVPIESSLIVPVVHRGEVLGSVNFYHPQAGAFGAHEQQLAEMVAQRAACALYNSIAFERARGHAETDPLTGLYNIRYLTEQVDRHCSQTRLRCPVCGLLDEDGCGHDAPRTVGREDDRFALLCLDLDSFKPINDNFGHQQGDDVLRRVARVLRETVRHTDVVARYGGDEFLVMLRSATREEAEAMAHRLALAIEQQDMGVDHPAYGALSIGASVGYACFPADGTDCATLIASADACMYRVKAERKLDAMATRGRKHWPAHAPGTPPWEHKEAA